MSEIVVRTENGKKLEPLERLVIDVPESFIGIILETLGSRRGEMLKMSNHNSGRVRMDFKIPSRGLIGLRSQLLTDSPDYANADITVLLTFLNPSDRGSMKSKCPACATSTSSTRSPRFFFSAT